MHRAPSPGLCSPGLPPRPERKEGLGFSHGPTAVTGSVSLNYRDTMCINRVITSDPLRQTERCRGGQNQSYSIFGLWVAFPT